MNLLLLSVAVFSGHLLFGSVRTLWMNEEKMETVYTALGKSTILRFIETPDRIVIGDQNSYKIEFTGNTVAVKPTGGKETNLFIYTGTKAFGFILRDGGSTYDDLIHIRRKPMTKNRYTLKEVSPQTDVSLILRKIQTLDFSRPTVMVSLFVKNLPKERKLYVTQKGKRIKRQKSYVKDNEVRIIFWPNREKTFAVVLKYREHTKTLEAIWKE